MYERLAALDGRLLDRAADLSLWWVRATRTASELLVRLALAVVCLIWCALAVSTRQPLLIAIVLTSVAQLALRGRRSLDPALGGVQAIGIAVGLALALLAFLASPLRGAFDWAALGFALGFGASGSYSYLVRVPPIDPPPRARRAAIPA